MVRVQVPATTANLGPGFDCLGMALNMFNTVEMAETCSGLTIEVRGEGSSAIARDESNIVYRSALKVFKKNDYNPPGLRIRLVNNIPVSRGLGSSASAIVGGIVAANVLSGRRLSTGSMLKIAADMEGHPDNVAPALLGGIVVYTRSDDDIYHLKIDPPPGLKAVAAVPDYPLSTFSAREILPERLYMEDAVFNIGRVALLVSALQKGEFDCLGIAMEDRLHQVYREGMIPGMKKVFAAAKLAGAKGVAVSGAGPTLLALADKNTTEIARVMKDTFHQSGVKAVSHVLDISPMGARALEIK